MIDKILKTFIVVCAILFIPYSVSFILYENGMINITGDFYQRSIISKWMMGIFGGCAWLGIGFFHLIIIIGIISGLHFIIESIIKTAYEGLRSVVKYFRKI